MAIYYTLLGQNVNVITSSEILAERDSEEWSELYGIFNIRCQHICAQEIQDSIDKRKIIYE